jgi:hypothetical protein
MPNRATNLVILVKTESGAWSRYPIVTTNNGSLRKGWAMVDGDEVHFASFTYQMRWYEGKRLVYKTMGKDTADVMAKFKIARSTRTAQADGVTVMEESPDRALVTKTAAAFVNRIEKQGKFVAAPKYKRTMAEFREAMPSVVFVDQITEDAVLTYFGKMRKLGYADQKCQRSM